MYHRQKRGRLGTAFQPTVQPETIPASVGGVNALTSLVGMAFVWSTLRDQDMVAVGTMSPDEARELLDISLSILERRQTNFGLQHTRSKRSVSKTPDPTPDGR